MIIRNLILTSVLILAVIVAPASFATEGDSHNHSSHSYDEGGTAFQGMVKDYLFIQAALAGDTTEGVAIRASSIEKASLDLSKTFDPMMAGIEGKKSGDLKKILPELRQAAAGLARAENIEEARISFGKLSDSMIAYRELATGEKPQVAYCPMAKKSWMQNGKSITNPYYGSSMLRCGSFVANNP